jgi:threonine dehydrogenase-like Zn-dependent dehydrogenase
MSAVSATATDVATMRSAVLVSPHRAEVRDVAVPEPGPSEVRVRVEGCGVCGSDLPVWSGRPWFDYPLEPGAPGHEGWGRIDAIGPGVESHAEGERVAVLSSHAYAEYDIAPACGVVPLPSDLDGTSFPGEPLGCGVNVVRRARVGAGQTVAVIGMGFLGAVVTRLAAAAGSEVIAVSRRPDGLTLARELGAERALPFDGELVGRVQDLTDGELCDCVIEATGKQAALDPAARLTATRGRLVIAGFHQDGPREVDMQLWNWRGLDVINAHERDTQVYASGIREAVRLTIEGTLEPAKLLTHRFDLERTDEALATASERPPGFVKAVVIP